MSKMVLDALGFQPANSTSFGAPVQNITELLALTGSTLVDKQIRLVEDVGSMFRFDAESVVAPNAITVFRPSNISGASPGRWVGVTPAEAFIPVTQRGIANGVATLGADGKVLPSQLLTLDNGYPAYVEPVGGVLTSIDSTTYSFVLPTNGTRNAYLNTLGSVASNIKGFLMPRNGLIRGAVVSSSAVIAAGGGATMQVRVNGSTNPIASFVVNDGSDRSIHSSLSIPLNAGDEISAYMSAAKNVANPAMVLEISWRN